MTIYASQNIKSFYLYITYTSTHLYQLPVSLSLEALFGVDHIRRYYYHPLSTL